MKEPATENKPAIVGRAGASPLFPMQAGEAPARWAWVERSVWTERILKRLETSQEQTVWYSLWDKVWQPDNLAQAVLGVIVSECLVCSARTVQPKSGPSAMASILTGNH